MGSVGGAREWPFPPSHLAQGVGQSLLGRPQLVGRVLAGGRLEQGPGVRAPQRRRLLRGRGVQGQDAEPGEEHVGAGRVLVVDARQRTRKEGASGHEVVRDGLRAPVVVVSLAHKPRPHPPQAGRL